LGQPELLEHGGGGSGVGRRDDRTERDRSGDRKSGEAPADKRDRGRGEHDREHRQRDDRQGVAPQLLGRRIERGIEQRRGNEQRQREVRLDPDRGRKRQERDAGASDGEQRRIGHAQAFRGGRQHHGREQEDQYPFKKNHVRPVLSRSTAPSQVQ
jgi:hypothetical protein